MNCKKFYRDFSGYLDGTLPEERIEEIKKHIEGCEGCSSYNRIVTEGVHEYRERPELQMPDDFLGRLEHSIYQLEEEERLKRSRSPFRSFMRTISPVLSAGIAFAGFLYFFTSHTPSGQLRIEDRSARSVAVSSSSLAYVSPVRTEAFSLAHFLEGFATEYLGNRLSPLRSVSGGVPVTVEDPAFATFVSEDPSFSSRIARSSPTSSLIQTPMGFAAIPARMERPLSKLVDSENGLLVVDIKFMGKAFVAGLRKGDVIVSLDEKPIEQAGSLLKMVSERNSKTRALSVVRNGRVVNLKID